MIILYGFGPFADLPDPSPFVVKADMLLRMAGLPFRLEKADLRRAPKGKLPYIDDGGELIADSTFIRWHLEAKHGIDFDADLSERDRALAWSVEKMLEEHLYWAMVDQRWVDDENFQRGPARFFEGVPAPVRPLIKAMVRRGVRSALRAQGFGRHGPAEIARLGIRSIDAAASVLGDQPYLMGERPCGADATLYAFASGALCPVFQGPLLEAAKARSNLVAYCDRMRTRYCPELAAAAPAAEAA